MHLFQKYLIQFTLSHFTEKPHHIYYYGDVAALQYKNKFNFLNLCNHANNVGITEMVFLQHHMEKVHVMELVEQSSDLQQKLVFI